MHTGARGPVRLGAAAAVGEGTLGSGMLALTAAEKVGRSRCVVQTSNSGHQLLLPPANWCPIFASRTTQGGGARRAAEGMSPELKVRTPAHTKQLGWHVEFESRVMHPSAGRARLIHVDAANIDYHQA